MNDTLEKEGTASAVPSFTYDWFSQHIPLWEYLMEDHLQTRSKFLEIGSFEGYSACWMLQKALAPDGFLYCVDTWEGSPEFHSIPEDVVQQSFARFNQNIALSKGKHQEVIALKNRSVDALAGLIHLEHSGTFDLIYIDGGHDATDVLRDAVMAWPLLKVGGLLIFDDYVWELHHGLHGRPKMAIDTFTQIHNQELRTISVGQQYVVQKTL